MILHRPHGERLHPCDLSTQDEGVDVVRALVSVDSFKVHHVPDDVVLIMDAVAAEHVPRSASNSQGLACDHIQNIRMKVTVESTNTPKWCRNTVIAVSENSPQLFLLIKEIMSVAALLASLSRPTYGVTLLDYKSGSEDTESLGCECKSNRPASMPAVPEKFQ